MMPRRAMRESDLSAAIKLNNTIAQEFVGRDGYAGALARFNLGTFEAITRATVVELDRNTRTADLLQAMATAFSISAATVIANAARDRPSAEAAAFDFGVLVLEAVGDKIAEFGDSNAAYTPIRRDRAGEA